MVGPSPVDREPFVPQIQFLLIFHPADRKAAAASRGFATLAAPRPVDHWTGKSENLQPFHPPKLSFPRSSIALGESEAAHHPSNSSGFVSCHGHLRSSSPCVARQAATTHHRCGPSSSRPVGRCVGDAVCDAVSPARHAHPSALGSRQCIAAEPKAQQT